MTKIYEHPKLGWIAKETVNQGHPFRVERDGFVDWYNEPELISLGYEESKQTDNLRERVKERKSYYSFNSMGEINEYAEVGHVNDDLRFNFGNYYKSEEGAMAVDDLRKHVYKYGPYIKCEPHYYICEDLQVDYFEGDMNKHDEINILGFQHLPGACTQEDIDERIRLIKDCQIINGFTTI